jgi:hypothetical protein
MAEVESVVEPYCILDDCIWKPITIVDIWFFHSAIIAKRELTFQYLFSGFSAETVCRDQTVWRRERDSNPRYAINVYTLSRRAPSTARPPLRRVAKGI